MADFSKLSSAPDHHDVRQQHHSPLPPQSKSKRIVTQNVTSEFFAAASGPCNSQAWSKTEYSPDFRQLSIPVNLLKMNTSLYSKQWEHWR